MSGGRVVTVDADSSAISTDVSVVPADGTTPVTVYVTAKQDRNNANLERMPMARLAASNVTITVTPSTGVTITQPTGVLGADGATTATFVSTNAATVAVGASICGRAIVNTATVVVGGGAPVDPPDGDPFFSDDFTGTQRNNDNGFTWGSGGSRVTVASFDGFDCLRFRYGADADGADSSAQQSFNMGRDCAAVWIDYDLYVPANFAHRSQSGATNNKFLMIWNTTYGSGSGTWQGGYEYTRSDATNSNIRIMSTLESGSNADSVTNRPSFTDNGKAFIGAARPLVPGAWNRVRLQFQRSSASGVADGVMRVWIGDDLFAETFGLFRNVDNIGDTVLRNGYFMGWSNSGFTDETIFYAKRVRFYDTNPGWL
jgi:hypothetical protein